MTVEEKAPVTGPTVDRVNGIANVEVVARTVKLLLEFFVVSWSDGATLSAQSDLA